MTIRTDFHDLSHDELVRLLRLTFDGETFEEAAISVLEGAPEAGTEVKYRLVCRRSGNVGANRWTRIVEPAAVETLLACLEDAMVPALPAPAPGGEEAGHVTELVFARGARSVAYSWWGKAPTSYTPLAEFARDLERIAGLGG